MNDESFAQVVAVVSGASSWHFDKRSTTRNERTYSQALRQRVDQLSGETRMSVAQLEFLWDTFMSDTYPKLQEELGDQLSNDQVGRFFSSILAQHIDTIEMSNRQITLRIPEYADGQIYYLASNLQQGAIAIKGNVGSMTGANNRGVVTVIVSGDAAHLTGANSSAYASVVVRGAVGSRTGEGMRDQASVFARSIRETSPNREETTRVGLLVE